MACQGIYADVQYTNTTEGQVKEDLPELANLQEQYNSYKRSFTENLVFDRSNPNHTSVIPYQSVQVIQIYFDTATYDEVEKDEKVTVEAQLGVVGGTMGLLTGFSIISGVEIVYFSIKLFFMILRQHKLHI